MSVQNKRIKHDVVDLLQKVIGNRIVKIVESGSKWDFVDLDKKFKR